MAEVLIALGVGVMAISIVISLDVDASLYVVQQFGNLAPSMILLAVGFGLLCIGLHLFKKMIKKD
jgi:uncharacterized membrane protein YczE